MITLAGNALKQALIVSHEPDHQFSLQRHARVDHRVLEIRRLPFFIRESELDRGMLFGPGIDLIRALGEIKPLGFCRTECAAKKERSRNEVFRGGQTDTAESRLKRFWSVHDSRRFRKPNAQALGDRNPAGLFRVPLLQAYSLRGDACAVVLPEHA